MADDKKDEGGGHNELWMILLCFALLVGAWWYSGAMSRADLRGIFLQPPPPVGPGGAYGPNPLASTSVEYRYSGSYNASSTYPYNSR